VYLLPTHVEYINERAVERGAYQINGGEDYQWVAGGYMYLMYVLIASRFVHLGKPGTIVTLIDV